MTNTNLIEIIKAFSPKKRQEIASFLSSTYFNRGKNAAYIQHLYRIILETAPEFSENLLTKKIVYTKLFNEATIDQGKLEKVIYDLNKLLQKFALTDQYHSENNEIIQQIEWARWLRLNGLPDASKKVILKLENKIANELEESLDLFRVKWLVFEELHHWESFHNQFRGDLGIPKVRLHLNLFFETYDKALKNRYLLQQKATQLPNAEDMDLEMIEVKKSSILMSITEKINAVLQKDFPTIEETRELMSLLQESEHYLNPETLDHFYAYLRNFCTLLINNGKLDFISVLFDINKDNLPRGYFFINEEIAPNPYLNLVQVATRAKEFEWAKEFTEAYKERIIGGDEARFFYLFNMAHCLFAEGKFNEALDYIPDAPSSSHYHHMVRRLELKIYYELNSDLLLYKMDAFRKFIARTATKTISTTLRTMDLNFLNILMQITQTPMKDKARSARLVIRIEGKKLLADRAWLLEKARSLS